MGVSEELKAGTGKRCTSRLKSRRPLLKCAEILPFVISPSRRSVGVAEVSKELKKQGLPGVRLFTVEVNIAENVAFARAAWGDRVQATKVCYGQ